MNGHQFLLPNVSRNRRRRLIAVLSLTAGVLSASSREAYAYLDPGISSMLAQFVIAAVVAVAVSARRVFDTIKKTAHNLFARAKENARIGRENL
jgi:hypothetical protein